MSRLLKEDAAMLGEAYEQIFNEMIPGSREEGRIPGILPKGAFASPFAWQGGGGEGSFNPQDIAITPDEIVATTQLGKEEITYKPLSMLQSPTWIANGHVAEWVGRLQPKAADAPELKEKKKQLQAKFFTDFARKFAEFIKEHINKQKGGVHPSLKRASKTLSLSPLAAEIAEWVLKYKHELKMSDGTTQQKPVVLTPHGARWVADQLIKNILLKKGAVRYFEGEDPGDSGVRRGSKIDDGPLNFEV